MGGGLAIALSIGNSRYHWGLYEGQTLIKDWRSPYYDDIDLSGGINGRLVGLDEEINWENIPLYVSSVVPSQSRIWSKYPRFKEIKLEDIPLGNLYSTLGIDRAIALYSAGEKYGYPVLVIDGGTALTFTGVDRQKQLIGGAILPGIKLQINSLFQGTAALPNIEVSYGLIDRWQTNTEGAIASGIMYTIVAGIKDFIEDWLRNYPLSKIVITGGDRSLIINYLEYTYPSISIIGDEHLILDGIIKVSLP